MSSLSSTRHMFNFILVLYFLGFVVMVTRWKTTSTRFADDDSVNQDVHRRDERHVLINTIEETPEVADNAASLTIDKEIPVLQNISDAESKEIPPKVEKTSNKKTGSTRTKVDKKKTSGVVGKSASTKNKDDVRPVKPQPPKVEAAIKKDKKPTDKGMKQSSKRQSKGKEQAPKETLRKETKAKGKKVKPDEKTLWKKEQAKRKETLRRTCKMSDSLGQESNVSEIIKSHKRNLWPFIVNDKYRLIYTFISKVGSTNWKSAFLVLNGKYKTVEEVPGKFAHSPSLLRLNSFPDNEIKQRFDHYTNFIFVRHPFARVLSAYRSKFIGPNKTFQKSIGIRIIKKYRKNPTKEALANGNDVTFHEFVQSIGNAKVINFDGHWQPIYKMVQPCAVRFDYIGKLETSEVDAKHLLEEINLDHLIHFKPSKANASHDDAVFSHYYSNIPKEDLLKLYKVYEPDFKLFGYQVPNYMKYIFKDK